MPIRFEQPGVVTPIAGLGAATDVLLKSNAALASIYEAGIRAGAGRGGGGTIIPASGSEGPGGGRGGGQTYTPYQAEPRPVADHFTSDRPDYVGSHIQEREAERQQLAQYRQQQEAEMNAKMQAQYGQKGPAPEFGPQDIKEMDNARNTMSELNDRYQAGLLDADNPDAVAKYAGAQQKLTALQRKQQDAAKYQEDRVRKQQAEGMAHETSLYQTAAKHTEEFGYRPIRGLPVPDMRLGPDGKWYMVNKDVFHAAVEKNKADDAHNSKLDIERAKSQIKDPIIEQKLEHEAMKTYLGIRDKVEQQWIKEETEWMKGSTDKNVARWTEEGREADVARIMRIKGFPGTLAEAVAQHKAEREAERSGNRPASQAQPSQENKALIKQSDPEAVAGFWNQVSTMPRLPTGHPDLARSTPEQLDKLDEYYTNYKAIGVSAEIAAKWRKAIAAAKAEQKTPEKDFKHTPPATSRMGRGAANIAGEAPYVGNRLAEGALKIGGDVYDDVFTPIAQGGLKATGINSDTVRGLRNYAGFLGESARDVAGKAGTAMHSAADEIERRGARIFSGPSPYDVFKRWLGK